MSPAPFEVQAEQHEGEIYAFAVQGELDMNTVRELETALEEPLSVEGAAVVLDLSDCEFIDSTGIAMIVRTWKRLDDADGGGPGGRFALCCVNQQVRRLFEITGLEASIAMYEQVADAVAGLQSGRPG